MIFLAAATAVVAVSQPGPVQSAFEAGRWTEALALGQAADSASEKLAAGRSATTIAMFIARRKRDAIDLLLQADKAFEAALLFESANHEARLHRAIATGYRARLERSASLARQARQELEAAVKRAPDDPLARAALAGWHGEAVLAAGPLVARAALGAKSARAVEEFEAAIALQPEGPVVPAFAALTLLSLSQDHVALVRSLLDRVDQTEPADAFDALVQAQSRDVLLLLKSGDPKGATALARLRSPFGTIK